jgi:hypothetical protein
MRPEDVVRWTGGDELVFLLAWTPSRSTC